MSNATFTLLTCGSDDEEDCICAREYNYLPGTQFLYFPTEYAEIPPAECLNACYSHPGCSGYSTWTEHDGSGQDEHCILWFEGACASPTAPGIMAAGAGHHAETFSTLVEKSADLFAVDATESTRSALKREHHQLE